MRKTALFIACLGLIVGFGLASPQSADAGIRVSFGSGYGCNSGYGYGYNRGYSSYGLGYNRGYSSYGLGGGYYGGSLYRGSYYNRGHYDYHPTTVVPHGNHLHVIPGHYDYHYGSHGYHH
jgi:hypothetical protein